MITPTDNPTHPAAGEELIAEVRRMLSTIEAGVNSTAISLAYRVIADAAPTLCNLLTAERQKREAVEKQLALAQDVRAEGRKEALAILLNTGAEEIEDYMVSSSLGDTGDYSTSWDEDKLKVLFEVDSRSSFIERLDGGFWEIACKLEDAKHARAKAESDRDTLKARVAELERELSLITGEMEAVNRAFREEMEANTTLRQELEAANAEIALLRRDNGILAERCEKYLEVNRLQRP